MNRLCALFFIGIFALLVSTLAGCGGGGTSTSSLRIVERAAVVEIGKPVQLSAVAKGGDFAPIAWRVEDANGGSVTADGLYTAPSTSGTFRVTAYVIANPSISDTVNVVVSSGIVVTIDTPAVLPRVTVRSTLDLKAKVTGSKTTEQVTWFVQEGTTGGSVSTSGVYTAPAAPGTFTVVARSVENPTRTATRTITVFDTARVNMEIAGKGTVSLTLNFSAAPITSANFVSLVNKGFYDGIRFHRYEPAFVIQWGDPNSKTLPIDDPSLGQGGPGYQIPFEVTGLTHVQYAVAMASTGDQVGGGSQIYITLTPQPSLDGRYCVFGLTTAGQSIVDSLRKGDTITRATVSAP